MVMGLCPLKYSRLRYAFRHINATSYEGITLWLKTSNSEIPQKPIYALQLFFSSMNIHMQKALRSLLMCFCFHFRIYSQYNG